MVTAGVYMIVRCSAIYTNAPTAMFIIAIVGAATALFAATIGLAQNDIKKVLAYSTISQLGYMMLACGVGAFVAAIFHVMTHAFFKALLFLGSGSVIHGMHHEQDMRRMGGLKKYMKITFLTMCTGWLAICGIVPFSGFFSKDEILWKTWSTHANGYGKILWVVGALTAGLTAVYMTRLMVMTFWGTDRFREAHAGGQADEAHAHAFDEGDKPHDAQLASTGDRPHHEPGEKTDDAHAMHHDATSHDVATAHHAKDEHDDDDDHAHDAHGHVVHEPHESPWVMTVPLIVLAILSTLGGLIGIPYALSGGKIDNYFEHTLEPAVAHAPETVEAAGAPAHEGAQSERPRMLSPEPQPHDGASPLSVGEGERAVHSPEELNAERLFSGISLAIALAGIGLGWFMFQKRPLLQMPRLLENKYYVDEAYDAAIINPIKSGSREGLWKLFDVAVIDGIVNGLGRSVAQIGGVLRYMQIGFVRSYAAIILLGALTLIGYFVIYFVVR
jgi:NADH-quinone oxidoreductase subunit L